MKKTSDRGISIIKYFESLHDGDLSKIGLQPKMDPTGIWTIGYGHALKDINGKWLKGVEGYKRLTEIYPDFETITEEEAEELLSKDLLFYEKSLNKLELDLNQNQFDALISLCFNIGIGNFKNSSLLKLIKDFHTTELIRDEFLKWVYSGGEKLKGLINRRKTEALLFCKNKLKFTHDGEV